MKINHILLVIIILGTLSISEAESFSLPVSAPKAAFAIGGGAAGLFFGYKAIAYAYKSWKQYLEDKIVTKAVDAIMVAFTPHATLSAMTESKRITVLHQKAQLIMMRKRVMIKLQKMINKPDQFSLEHLKILKQELDIAVMVFKGIDLLRKDNPYEKEYDIPSVTDTLIERAIIDSIILQAKPDNECTTAELAKKQESAQRRELILGKLKGKIKDIYWKALRQSAIFLALLAR